MVNARAAASAVPNSPRVSKQGCLSGSRLRRGSSCLQRKNGSLARRLPGDVAFVCRARQSIVDVVQATVLPALFRPAEFHDSLSLQWLTTRLMFPRIGPAAQLATRAIASLTGEDHLRTRGLAHVMAIGDPRERPVRLDHGAINQVLPRPRRGVPKLIGFWIRSKRLALLSKRDRAGG